VDLGKLAEKTEGYTGADIAAVCREAALIALRENMKPTPVTMKHFEKALKAVPRSLKEEDIKRYERLAEEVKRASV
jgi:transitional endoplasmic reticulum ATPase